MPPISDPVELLQGICRECLQPFRVKDRRVKFCSSACALEGKAKVRRRLNAEHRESHPGRERCRQALKNAVIAGAIRRPEKCEGCGVVALVEGHHEDYSRPFFVQWLCRPCHNALDGGRHFGAGQRKPSDSAAASQAS